MPVHNIDSAHYLIVDLIGQVELVVMKALSLGLVKGSLLLFAFD